MSKKKNRRLTVIDDHSPLLAPPPVQTFSVDGSKSIYSSGVYSGGARAFAAPKGPAGTGRVSELVLVGLFVVLSALSSVFAKRAAIAAPFPFALTILQPICTTVLFTLSSPASPGWRGGWRRAGPWPFVAIGALLCLGNLLQFEGAQGTVLPGGVITLEQQVVVVFSAAIGVLAHGFRRYHPVHLAGVLTVLAGVAVCVWPELTHARADHSGALSKSAFVVGAQIPNALALALMEHTLAKHPGLPVLVVWALVNIAEAIFALPMVATMYLLQSRSLHPRPFLLWTSIDQGFSCLAHCHNAALYFSLFILALVASKAVQAMLVRIGTTAMFVAQSGGTALAEVLFCLKFVMGAQRQRFDTYLGIGAPLTIIGVVLYRIKREKRVGDNDGPLLDPSLLDDDTTTTIQRF